MLQSDKHDVDITNVEPYTYRTNSEKLLSLLKPLINSEKNRNRDASYHSFSLPIFQGIDISNIIEENNSKIHHSNDRILNIMSSESAKDDEKASSNDEIGSTSKFIKLESFIPKNLQEQITTVIIKGLPNLKIMTIERLLLKLITNSNFNWTMIDQDFIDNKIVFIRFKNLNLLCWFLDNYTKDITEITGLPGIELFWDSKLADYKDNIQNEHILNELDRIKIKNDIHRILSIENNSNRISENTGTEDLDEVLNYYSNYKIDDSELIDVPTNMKEIIIKDIIKFRSKVLVIEKKRRKNEIDLERKKTGQRLKQIFEGKETTNNSLLREEPKSNVPAPVVDELDFMNDEEYEKYKREKENDELEKKFTEKLQSHISKEVSERGRLIQKLNTLQNYESDLIANKLAYIEEIKNHNESNSLYFADHGEYMQRRNIRRAEEEKNDTIDMEADESTKDYNMDTRNDESTSKVSSEMAVVESNISNIIISTLAESKINAIKERIANLIEEYLGITDDFLINMILEFLMKFNLNNKEDLIKELSEPLDDDAAILVNDLWSFVSSL